eukprot:4305043-Amphidinium_carterae.1
MVAEPRTMTSATTEMERHSLMSTSSTMMTRKRTTQQYHMYMRQHNCNDGKDENQVAYANTIQRKKPQFTELAGEVKAYLTIHNVYFEDYMDKSTNSIETVNISDIQDDYTAQDVLASIIKFPQRLSRDDTDDYDEYNEMQLTIKKKRDDIMSFGQTVNYVLVHATKPGGEAKSFVRGVMN